MDAIRTIPFSTISAASQSDSFVADKFRKLKAFVRSLNATGGNAADTIRFFPAGNKGQTTVNTTAAAAATSVIVDADDNGADINGNIITTSDFLLVNLDSGNNWQLLTIGGVSADAANDRNTLSTLGAFDGGTGLESAVTVVAAAPTGAGTHAFNPEAYIIFAADVQTLNLGIKDLNLEFTASGNAGHPLALTNDGNAAVSHFMQGVIQYIN